MQQGRGTTESESTRKRHDSRAAEIERLRARVAELEDEQARLKDFAAMAAHELLQPLVMTQSYAEMLSERTRHGLDLDSRRDLDALIRISARVRRLVEALLADAREHHAPLRMERVDLKEVVADCVRSLDFEIREQHARVDIDPMPVVNGDPALLSGVFGNLLANALRYGRRDGTDIHLSVTRSDAGWTFTVDSPGPAIPAAERQRIFEPWARGRGERRSYGAGLGLAIVRQIVERHGGQLGIMSPDGHGNRFFFTLPA